MGLIVNGRMKFLGKFEGVFPQLPPPTPSFTASPTTGLVPLTVQFANTTTATAVSYEWDFTGDGTVDSTDVNPSYTYANTGTYSVSLTVVNTGGRITTTASNYIVAYTIAPASYSGVGTQTFPFRMAVFDDSSYIGQQINSFPFVISGDRSSETYVGQGINSFPFVMSGDRSSETYIGTENTFPFTMANSNAAETYVGTENTFPFVMTNYVHS